MSSDCELPVSLFDFQLGGISWNAQGVVVCCIGDHIGNLPSGTDKRRANFSCCNSDQYMRNVEEVQVNEVEQCSKRFPCTKVGCGCCPRRLFECAVGRIMKSYLT